MAKKPVNHLNSYVRFFAILLLSSKVVYKRKLRDFDGRAEPLKKKIDPAVVRAQEERKKMKLEKQIRRLEKYEQQLKPVSELEVPTFIVDNYEYIFLSNSHNINSSSIVQSLLFDILLYLMLNMFVF